MGFLLPKLVHGMETKVDQNTKEWYDYYMKKSNNKASQHKIKRAQKNKKRLKDKPHFSKFEREQNRIREEIIMGSLMSANRTVSEN
jgi:hypothetical protein